MLSDKELGQSVIPPIGGFHWVSKMRYIPIKIHGDYLNSLNIV